VLAPIFSAKKYNTAIVLQLRGCKYSGRYCICTDEKKMLLFYFQPFGYYEKICSNCYYYEIGLAQLCCQVVQMNMWSVDFLLFCVTIRVLFYLTMLHVRMGMGRLDDCFVNIEEVWLFFFSKFNKKKNIGTN
jgi:hypothetical protein